MGQFLSLAVMKCIGELSQKCLGIKTPAAPTISAPKVPHVKLQRSRAPKVPHMKLQRRRAPKVKVFALNYRICTCFWEVDHPLCDV
jgi:hypothetical protein